MAVKGCLPSDIAGYHRGLKATLVDLMMVAVMGLAPLTWRRADGFFSSVDLMVPPDWSELAQFTQVWATEIGTGGPMILDSGRLPTLFIAAALQAIGIDAALAQLTQFIFWFMLSGYAMYALSRSVLPCGSGRAVLLAPVMFHMFNLWLISNWLGYKEPMIAAVISVPLALALWIRVLKNDSGYWWGILLTGPIAMLSWPIGNNPSEMLAAMTPIPLLFIWVFCGSLISRSWGKAVRIGFAGAGALGIWLLASAIWIVPGLLGVTDTISDLSVDKRVYSSRAFLEGQSLYTSIENNLRLLSDWTWYQGLVDPYQTYSQEFLGNPIIVALGWALVILVLLGAVIGRGVFKGYFTMLAILGITLGAGLNSPFGEIYKWAIENIPFLWIVRSPWFKFTLFTVIGYSVLLGMCMFWMQKLLVKIVRLGPVRIRHKAATISAVGIFGIMCAIGPMYSYPFSLGLFFATEQEREFLNPNFASPPNYVLDAAEWINSQPEWFRVLAIPGDSPWLNDWGYSGFGSYMQWATSKPIVYKRSSDYVKIGQGAPNSSEKLIEELDKALLDRAVGDVVPTLQRLGVRYILHEKDVRYDFYQGPGYRADDSPVSVSQLLDEIPQIKLAASFGEWDLWEVPNHYPQFWISAGVGVMQSLTSRDVIHLLGNPWLKGLPLVKDKIDGLVVRTISADVEDSPDVFIADSVLPAATERRPPPTDIELKDGDPKHWGKLTSLPGSGQWRWLTKNQGEHYVIINNSPSFNLVNIESMVFSPSRDRTFYYFVNGQYVHHDDVKADVVTAVSVDGMRLEPGSNTLSFYTPFASDRIEGEDVAFAVLQDPQLFTTAYSWKVPAPVHGEYPLIVNIGPTASKYWPQGLPNVLYLQIDDSTIVLETNDEIAGQYTGTVLLSPMSKVSVSQQYTEDYYLAFGLGQLSTIHSSGEVKLIQRSPSRYRMEIQSAKPATLIFNESHHGRWGLKSSKGAAIQPNIADDYSSSYLMGTLLGDVAVLEYELAGWYRIAIIVSSVTVMGSGLCYLLMSFRGGIRRWIM